MLEPSLVWFHRGRLGMALSDRVARRYKQAVGVVIGLMAASVVSGPLAAQELNVSGIYGGHWAEGIRASFLKPFETSAKAKLNIEEGISSVTLAKLRQQKDSPALDVVFMDRIVSDTAIAEGLVEPMDPKAFTNMADVTPAAFIKDKSGNIMAVTVAYWAIGLAYNTKDIKTKPESWLDLAKAEYKGKVAVYSTDNAIGLPFLVTLASIQGGGVDKMESGFAFIGNLSKQGAIFFGGSPAGGNLLASGEASIASLASSQVWDLQAKGHPIAYVVPKEGAIAGDMRMHIVKGAKNRELANKLINFAVGVEPQQAISTVLLVGPVNTKSKLAPDIAAKMPWGEKGSAASLRLVDANAILANRDNWIARWNKEIGK
ncbi:MAG: ABC transporter substrate-binding protein [Alphaproteobacteria bacterium]